MNFQPHSAVLDDKTECECVFYQPRPSSIEGIRDIILCLNPSHFTAGFVSISDLLAATQLSTPYYSRLRGGIVKMIWSRTGLTNEGVNIWFLKWRTGEIMRHFCHCLDLSLQIELD